MIVWISRALALAIHDRQLAEHGGATGIRDEGLLESALARPRQLHTYGQPAPDLADLAAATDQYEAKLRMQGLEQASDVEVSLAASAVAKAKAQIDLYQFQISQCSIRAPWSGSTAKLHVRSHMTVSAGQPLLDLVRSGLLLLKLNVPSNWMSTLKMGHEFEVTIDETGNTYAARVHRINSRVDPVSQTIELEATMLKSHADLLPGMSGVAKFTGMR